MKARSVSVLKTPRGIDLAGGLFGGETDDSTSTILYSSTWQFWREVGCHPSVRFEFASEAGRAGVP